MKRLDLIIDALERSEHIIDDAETPISKALAAARELREMEPKLIGWRTDDFLMETNNIEKAQNWSAHHEIIPIFEGDPNTKLYALGDEK